MFIPFGCFLSTSSYFIYKIAHPAISAGGEPPSREPPTLQAVAWGGAAWAGDSVEQIDCIAGYLISSNSNIYL